MFAEKVVDKFLKLNNVGLIKNASGTGVNVEEACKNTYKIYLSVENDKVVDAKFKAFGNPNFVVACDEITEALKGKTIDGILNISDMAIKQIIEDIDPEISKQVSVVFFKTAIANTVKDYKKKKEKEERERKKK